LHKDQNDIAQSITRFKQHVLQHPDEVLHEPEVKMYMKNTPPVVVENIAIGHDEER